MNKQEQNIMLILSSFAEELEEKLGESIEQIERIKYYEKFQINGIDFKDIFITEQKDVDGNISYHVYSSNTSREIIRVNSDGQTEISPELKKFLGEVDLEESMLENEREGAKLRGVSEKVKDKEIEKNQEEKVEEQIQQDLSKEQDLEISYYREIKDNNFDDRTKSNFNGCQEKGIAFDKKTNSFMMVVKINGQFQRAEGFELAKPTMKTVISLDEKGEKVEKKIPHALMKTKDTNKEVSITIGQYGYIEAATVDRIACGERIEIQHEESGETTQGRTERTLMSSIKAEGVEGLHNWAHEHEELIEGKEKDETIEKEDIEDEITNGGKHIYTNEEEKLIEEAAKNRAKMSVEGFKKILEEETQKNEDIEQRIDEAVEVAEEQSRGK